VNSNQTIVIGGGAAGLMAAGQAALAGARVTVLEKMKQPGRKIGISGKGRCNLTNTADIDDSLAKFGPNGKFLRQCFHRFHTPELRSFFESQGLALVTERGGRIFPASGKALDVVRTFKRWLSTLPVEISLNSTVERLVISTGLKRAAAPSMIASVRGRPLALR
jgi:predicted Rossmann fold flavoprotein